MMGFEPTTTGTTTRGSNQLSYIHQKTRLVGLEPTTLGLEGRCSILLSYKRIKIGVEGLEPTTLCSQSRCATKLRHTPFLLYYYNIYLYNRSNIFHI